jgi:dipeptidyl aminopeptidase/acylaminoacyl peptidase
MLIRINYLIIAILCLRLVSYSQDIAITNKSILDWTHIDPNIGISTNGKYIYYCTSGDYSQTKDLHIKSIAKGWNKDILNVKDFYIQPEFKFGLFTIGKDSLGLFVPGTTTIRYSVNVRSYKAPPNSYNDWYAFQVKDSSNSLFLCNFKGGDEIRIPNVVNYQFDNNGTKLTFTAYSNKHDSTGLYIIDFRNPNKELIKLGKTIIGFSFNKSFNDIAFIENNDSCQYLYTYNIHTKKLRYLVSDTSMSLCGFKIVGVPKFRIGDNWLYFRIQPKVKQEKRGNNTYGSDISIYNYLDRDRQPKFPGNYNKEEVFNVRLNVNNKDTYFGPQYETEFKLQNAGDYDLITFFNNDTVTGSLRKNVNHVLFNLVNRNRINLKAKQPICYVSPFENFIVFYEEDSKSYVSYNIKSNEYKNISRLAITHWNDDTKDKLVDMDAPDGLCSWLDDRNSVLIYDNYDIWKLDLNGIGKPINITNGLGARNRIKFQINKANSKTIVSAKSPLLLLAFNKLNKESGFYSATISKNTDPIRMSMGPYHYSQIVKCETMNLFLVIRESEQESPNLFLTKNFKFFTALTEIHPEAKYNWLTTELVSWNVNSKATQGILYKPENFDSLKRYPIIIKLYETFSDELHMFIQPDFCKADINIPYFVNQGYLVFLPDIHYSIGLPAESALNTVTSAVNCLVTRKWVNSKKMAIVGHSFGGYETNYIVAHCNLFAAAVSAAGVSNCISEYGSLTDGPITNQHLYELGQGRIGKTLWDDPLTYIRNSPIFSVTQVTTPILLIGNPNDYAVPFDQVFDFFNSLRRLGKKSWLLTYASEGHVILNYNNTLDYTSRLNQFLDYFLKASPKPSWLELQL